MKEGSNDALVCGASFAGVAVARELAGAKRIVDWLFGHYRRIASPELAAKVQETVLLGTRDEADAALAAVGGGTRTPGLEDRIP